MKNVALALFALLGGAMAAAPAQAQSVSLDCGGSNLCFVTVQGLSYDTIAWSFDKQGTDALFPRNCTNLDWCDFHCPKRPGSIAATVRLVASNQIVASATTQAACTKDPL
ncbi:hypothetical protein ACHZ97_16995 [Lysobacter soli]|uniref:hypothetical protein n=1 Tax=Lysobacter soli TaxID=453783 RepID=UPI0037C6B69F